MYFHFINLFHFFHRFSYYLYFDSNSDDYGDDDDYECMCMMPWFGSWKFYCVLLICSCFHAIFIYFSPNNFPSLLSLKKRTRMTFPRINQGLSITIFFIMHAWCNSYGMHYINIYILYISRSSIIYYHHTYLRILLDDKIKYCLILIITDDMIIFLIWSYMLSLAYCSEKQIIWWLLCWSQVPILYFYSKIYWLLSPINVASPPYQFPLPIHVIQRCTELRLG